MGIFDIILFDGNIWYYITLQTNNYPNKKSVILKNDGNETL